MKKKGTATTSSTISSVCYFLRRHCRRRPCWERILLFVLSTVMMTDHNNIISSAQSSSDFPIGGPVVDYRGLRLILDYEISDQLLPDDVTVELFRDEGCNDQISDENIYMTPEIVMDGTAGAAVGTQKVTVNYYLDGENIKTSPIISITETASVVAMCTKLSIRDPTKPSLTANSLNTPVIFQMILEGKAGIVAILEDQPDKYGVEVFECDNNNNPLTDVKRKSQQDTTRICIQPDGVALNEAVAMQSISEFQLEDGRITQSIISSEVVQDPQITEYKCTPGEKTCYIITSFKNDFFSKESTVLGSGIVKLMYAGGAAAGRGRGRRLIDVPIHIRRRTRTAGGSAGEKPFQISFPVGPSTASHNARAFLCSPDMKEIAEKDIKPKGYGDSVQICITPDEEALNAGVFMRDIVSFVFRQGDVNEEALVKPDQATTSDTGEGGQPAAKKDNTLLYDCKPGVTICTFRIALADYFFSGDGESIIGEGKVELQYGEIQAWGRRRTHTNVSLTSSTLSTRLMRHKRSIQTADPTSAGLSDVSITISVDPSATAPPEEQNFAVSFWTSMPVYAQVLMILGVLVSVLCFIVGAWCFIYKFPDLHHKRQDEPKFDDEYWDQERDFTYLEECHPERDARENGMLSTSSHSRGESFDSESKGRPTIPGIGAPSRMKSRSPKRISHDGTPSTHSSHSRGSNNNFEGSVRSRAKPNSRIKSLSPRRDIPGSNPPRSASGHVRSHTAPRCRMRSLSPQRSIRNDAENQGRSNMQRRGQMKSSSPLRNIQNRNRSNMQRLGPMKSLSPLRNTEDQGRSNMQPRGRMASLSPSRNIEKLGRSRSNMQPRGRKASLSPLRTILDSTDRENGGRFRIQKPRCLTKSLSPQRHISDSDSVQFTLTDGQIDSNGSWEGKSKIQPRFQMKSLSPKRDVAGANSKNGTSPNGHSDINDVKSQIGKTKKLNKSKMKSSSSLLDKTINSSKGKTNSSKIHAYKHAPKSGSNLGGSVTASSSTHSRKVEPKLMQRDSMGSSSHSIHSCFTDSEVELSSAKARLKVGKDNAPKIHPNKHAPRSGSNLGSAVSSSLSTQSRTIGQKPMMTNSMENSSNSILSSSSESDLEEYLKRSMDVKPKIHPKKHAPRSGSNLGSTVASSSSAHSRKMGQNRNNPGMMTNSYHSTGSSSSESEIEENLKGGDDGAPKIHPKKHPPKCGSKHSRKNTSSSTHSRKNGVKRCEEMDAMQNSASSFDSLSTHESDLDFPAVRIKGIKGKKVCS